MGAPIPGPLAGELQEFWGAIFGFSAEHPPDVAPEVFLGSEVAHNRLNVYLERRGETLAGTCTLTVSREVPSLGGFGEVATQPALRRAGIATRLCGRAVEEFRAGGG